MCFLILSKTVFSQSSSTSQTILPSPPAQAASRVFENNTNSDSSNSDGYGGAMRRAIGAKKIEPLYRKPTASELEFLKVEENLKDKYKQFLSQKNTGIFTLMPDLGCANDTKVVVATGICLQLTLPGAGASYSFRKNMYRLKRLADISFTDNQFLSKGKYAQGIIGNLGDVDIEKISLDSQGVKEINEFVPEKEKELIGTQYKKLEKGVIVNNILFSNKLKAVENSTFILRNVAYDTKHYTAIDGVWTYNEFEFDKRTDVLVAFRVLKKNEDGSLVILWKKLAERKSPKVIFPSEKVRKNNQSKFLKGK